MKLVKTVERSKGKRMKGKGERSKIAKTLEQASKYGRQSSLQKPARSKGIKIAEIAKTAEQANKNGVREYLPPVSRSGCHPS